MDPEKTDQEKQSKAAPLEAVRDALGKSGLFLRKTFLAATGQGPKELPNRATAEAAREAAEKAALEAAQEAAGAAKAARVAQEAAETAAATAAREADRACRAVQAARQAVEEARAAKLAIAALDAAEKAAEGAAAKAAREAARQAAQEAAERVAAGAAEREAAEQAAEEVARLAAEKAAHEAAGTAAREAAQAAAKEAAERASQEAAERETAEAAEAEQAARIAAADKAARMARAAKAAKAARAARASRFAKRAAEKAGDEQPLRPRRVNLALAISLVVGVVLLVVGVWGLHAYQVRRTARRMLDRAEQARRKNDLSEAIRYYTYYVNYVPEDDDAYSTLALLIADEAKQAGSNPKVQLNAHHVLERAASRQPENLDLIRRLADVSMKIGRMDVAAEQFAALIKEFPEETDLEVKLGRCQVANEDYLGAIASFEGVIGKDPQSIDAYVDLANLLHDQIDDADRADAVINQMVSMNLKSALAFLERGRFRRKIAAEEEASLEDARKDILQALEMAPNKVEVLVTASQVAMDDENFDEAWSYLDRARELHPEDETVLQTIAVLNVNMGKTDEAIDHLQAAVKQKTADPLTILSLADLQLRKGDVAAAGKTVKSMHDAGYRPEIVEYFKCRILVAQGDWRKASYALERLRTGLAGWPEFRIQIDLLLGACYEQLRLPDRQLEMYQAALDEDPTLVPARVGYAVALLRTGKLQEAADEYDKLEISLGEEEFLKIPSLRNNLFQLIVARTEQMPERDWTDLEEFIEKMEEVEGAGGIEKTLMRAELLAKTDRVKQARELVAAAREKDPKDLGLWIALAKLTAMDEGPRQGLEVLKEAAGQLGEELALRVAKADLLVWLDPDEAKPALAKLNANLDKLAEVQKVRLWRSLGAAYYRLRDRQKAKEFWNRVAEARPRDAKIRLTLFELARESGDEPGMKEATGDVKKRLGEHSSEAYYCEASQLVWKAQNEGTSQNLLGRAKQLLTNAARQRPGWQEIPRLMGEIALLEDNLDEAIDQLQLASDLGPLSPVYLGQLVRLLYIRGRFEQARDAMRKLGGRQVSLTMRRLEAELSFLTGDLEQALELASKTVADSEQAMDFLWYGQILARANKYDQARKAFDRALELDPMMPQAWPALVALLVREDKKAEAQQVILQAQTRLPEDRTPLVLGQCYHILGDLGRAEQNYLSAISLHPEDLSVIRSVARFYMLTGRSRQAQTYLDQIVTLASRDPEKHQSELVDARRLLARILAAAGDYRQLQQALKLLDGNTPPRGTILAEDLRLKAAMLASRTERESQEKAIELFVDQMRRSRKLKLTPAEQFTLAQLYEKTKKWADCRVEMESLLRGNPDNVGFLSAYIRMQLRNEDPLDAIKSKFDALEKLQPDAPLTRVIKAQLLAKEGETAEAVSLLKTLIPRPLPDNQLRLLPEVAKLMEGIEQTEEARKLLVELAEKAPGGKLTLADFLGRHAMVDQALDECEAVLDRLPVVAVLSTALSALLANRTEVTPEQISRVNAWFERALERGPVSKSVQLQLAGFHDLQDNYTEQARVYRELLARRDMLDRERAIVWNNLAFVMAAGDKNADEALEMINDAINVLGPSPELLDTRAVVLLATGQSQDALDALKDLGTAIKDSPTATMYFHRALAYQRMGDNVSAVKALQAGRERHRLTADQIPKIERDKYVKLVASLGNP